MVQKYFDEVTDGQCQESDRLPGLQISSSGHVGSSQVRKGFLKLCDRKTCNEFKIFEHFLAIPSFPKFLHFGSLKTGTPKPSVFSLYQQAMLSHGRERKLLVGRSNLPVLQNFPVLRDFQGNTKNEMQKQLKWVWEWKWELEMKGVRKGRGRSILRYRYEIM